MKVNNESIYPCNLLSGIVRASVTLQNFRIVANVLKGSWTSPMLCVSHKKCKW